MQGGHRLFNYNQQLLSGFSRFSEQATEQASNQLKEEPSDLEKSPAGSQLNHSALPYTIKGFDHSTLDVHDSITVCIY